MNIIETFQSVAKHLKIDKNLKQRVHIFERNFVNRSSEHSEFFSGNLLGVHKVRFNPSDSNTWFDEVLDIDDVELTTALHALPSVNAEFNVAGDVFYICCIALVHLTSKSALSMNHKKELMTDILLVMQYKMLTSKMANDFEWKADKEIMEAVKEAMSRKFHIKKYGSWYSLLLHRSEDIISTESIHHKCIIAGVPDESLLYVITDAKSRINSLVKNHWDLLIKIKNNDARIKDASVFVQTPEGAEIGDLTRELSVYRNYLHSVIGIKDNFIKDDIVYGVIQKSLHTLSMPMFVELLGNFSDAYNNDGDNIKEIVDDVLTHAFNYMYHTLNMGRNTNIDLAYTVYKLRGFYMSSRASSELLLRNRSVLEDLIRKNFPKRSSASIAAARTGLMLYLVIRALVRRHYVH